MHAVVQLSVTVDVSEVVEGGLEDIFRDRRITLWHLEALNT